MKRTLTSVGKEMRPWEVNATTTAIQQSSQRWTREDSLGLAQRRGGRWGTALSGKAKCFFIKGSGGEGSPR